jgi:dipeptidyl-peptidase-4
MRNSLSILIFGFILHAFFAIVAAGDERIDRALSLPRRIDVRVERDQVKPNWLPDGKSFWYQVQAGPQSKEFVLIDGETGKRTTATSREELGLPKTDEPKPVELQGKLRPSLRTGDSSGLKIVNKLGSDLELFWINPNGEQVRYEGVKAGSEREQHSYDGHVWLIKNNAGERLAVVEVAATVQTIVIDGKNVPATDASAKSPPRRNSGRGVSPDGKYRAFSENGVVMLRNTATEKTTHLKTELDESQAFRETFIWSPDSTAFVAFHCPSVPRRKITIRDLTPDDEQETKPREIEYIKPGDPLPQPTAVLFRLNDEGHTWQQVSSPLLADAYHTSSQFEIRWAADSSEIYFDYNRRGHQEFRVVAVNAKTGDVRAVVEEKSSTFIDYTNKTWRTWLDETRELLWMSERDGWCHLYLVDVKTGQVKNQITQGRWPVRRVLHVDEAAREVWFMASGLRAGEDPYYQHLCRVKLDGSDFKQLTDGDGQHQIEFSPNREVFLDTWSRVDLPPVSELRRSSDGQLLCDCEKADATKLLAARWTLPERFKAKGRDGETDIYGIIIKPSHFDPAKKYPIVEEVYAGPQSAFVPKEFGRQMRQHMIAELGFIVVQVDGQGTNHRGKKFHDVCWKNLKDAGFPDRIGWIKQAAKTRPWMDLDRVGIYGGSAGGQNAMRALLDHHDFYQVAVADCGCHDNRLDKLWWNEQWMGWPIDDSYARSSNLDDAHKLQGNLLLIVGEQDTNVDPDSTTLVVDALRKADKTFDYLPLSGTGHGAAETPRGVRARMEFLVQHLLP